VWTYRANRACRSEAVFGANQEAVLRAEVEERQKFVLQQRWELTRVLCFEGVNGTCEAVEGIQGKH
jgi:hypothetical protein